jgi:hypothetical protein
VRDASGVGSLGELYALSGRWDEVIKLTEGVTNEDDAAALLLASEAVPSASRASTTQLTKR